MNAISTRYRCTPSDAAGVRAGRTGSTLTEVLVSLMIMSIGVVSVISLFPLSVIRSVQATHLTNATVLRRNAETILEVANTQQVYFDSRIQPGVNDGRYVLDPLGFHLVEDGLFASQFQIPALGLGAMLRANGNTDENELDNDPTTVPSAPSPTPLERERAWRVCSSPDQWVDITRVTDVIPSGLNGARTEIMLPGMSAEGLSVGLTFPAVRVLLFDATGKTCHVRQLTSIDPSSDLVKWTEDLDTDGTLDAGEDLNFSGALDTYPLPAGFTPVTARAQVQDRRYSWMATVPPAGRTICVAVFFNRAFSPDDELVYDAQQVGNDPSMVDFGLDIGDFPAATVTRSPQLPAFAKRGTFLLDAETFEWYRIQNISEGNPTQVKLATLDGRSPTAPVRAAIVMRGIVDVYPIRPNSR